jgi:predicted acetyltransferase
VPLKLVDPDPRYHDSYLAALRELAEEGNGHYLELVLPAEPDFPGVDYSLERLREPGVFEEFCAYTSALDDPATRKPAGWVSGTYLWMVDEHDIVVGRISLRHELTPWLEEVGGHIGYAVRPSARRQGYGTVALGLMCTVAAELGIDPALVTCDEDNVASRKVIENNGGVLEDVRNAKMRFWVPTARPTA